MDFVEYGRCDGQFGWVGDWSCGRYDNHQSNSGWIYDNGDTDCDGGDRDGHFDCGFACISEHHHRCDPAVHRHRNLQRRLDRQCNRVGNMGFYKHGGGRSRFGWPGNGQVAREHVDFGYAERACGLYNINCCRVHIDRHYSDSFGSEFRKWIHAAIYRNRDILQQQNANVTASVTWSSSNTSVATISPGGLATGQGGGTTTISAVMNSVTGSTTATVTVSGKTNITTFHLDTNRSGLNDQKTVLTTANVAPATFGKLFSCPVDGYVYGEPLILSDQTINGAKHNVLYIATENDSVYAYDADNCGGGTPLWKVSLLQSGETPLADAAILPYAGVTSTPVIDPPSGTLYVVSTEESSSSGGTFRLSALNVDTGVQKFGGPVTINASVAATNSDSINGVQSLDTSCLQRSALLLANGNVYIGFGGCHSGWLLAYDASTLAQVGVFNASPKLNGEGGFASAGGIWMGGAGPVAGSEGNVYVTTGNGPWDGQTAWGDSVLKFGSSPVSGANGTMQPIDYFTPSIYQFMDCFDADLAAGGLLLIPRSTTLIAGGKTGTMYLVDSANLGHESSNDAGALQEQVWGAGLTYGGTYQQSCQDSTGTNYANIASYEVFGSAACFNGAVYLGVTPTSANAPGGVRQFDYTSTLSAQSDTSNYQNEGTYGTSPFISANGTNDGIVWYINQGNPLQNASMVSPTSASLLAYDASNFPTQLYSSTTNSGDTPGFGIKFSSPVVANGKVYISTGTDLTTVSSPRGEIDVYGLK